MIVILILVSVLFFVMIYVLFAPISVEINSEKMHFRIRFHVLASLTLLFRGEPALKLSVLGWSRLIRPAGTKAIKTTKKNEKRPGGRKPVNIRALLRVLRSFRVTRCHMDIDLGDMQLNGILYPLLWWVEWRSGIHTRINFTGKNEVVLELRNNFARMARAYTGR